MHSVILTEEQFIKLFESIKADFGSDNTPGSVASEVVTSPIIQGKDGDEEFSEPVTTDKIAHQVYPQMWGATMRGQNRG